MKEKLKVAVFGDSIFKGIVFNEQKNRYQYLERSCVETIITRHNMDCDNYSRFGQTSNKALPQITQILKKNVNYQYVIIELGGNDCDYKWEEVASVPWGEHKPYVALEQYEQNINAIIDEIKKYNIIPIIVTLPPISSKRYLNWISKKLDKKEIMKWLKEEEYIYKHQELYNHTLINIAIEKKIKLVDLRLMLLKIKDFENYLCIDGIHLNEAGHRIIEKLFNKGELKI